ncbi:MAG TPA: hypothetical protein VM846_01120 [Vicinamibacterales bacterium]|nr:hypothetical protein [Vicinamibacterales bacterium]
MRRLTAARSAARDAVSRPGGFAPWPVLTIVLALGALPQLAEAQGQGRGRPKAPQASAETVDGSAGGSSSISTSQFRQFGVWLDDATTRAEGGGSVGIGVGYWRGAGAALLDVPILDASYAVHDRFTLGASVPFYRSENAGATSRGVDDVYLSGKIVLIDPALKDARFGIAVIPVLELLSPGFYEDRVHFALPVSAEFRANPVRVYGSTGYFSRGAFFGAGAVEWTSPTGTSLTFSLTHSVPTSEDTTGLTGGRSDMSVAVGRALSDAASVYVGMGRTISSPDESNKTTFAISGGVSLSFNARPTP